MSNSAPKVVELQTIWDQSGSITVAELGNGLDFLVQRAYFIHGLKEQSTRGAHAHRSLHQLVIALNGSFSVDLEGRFGLQSFELNNPRQALLIPPMAWRNLYDFSKGAICFVLASQKYDEDDYVRDYDEFRLLLSA